MTEKELRGYRFAAILSAIAVLCGLAQVVVTKVAVQPDAVMDSRTTIVWQFLNYGHYVSIVGIGMAGGFLWARSRRRDGMGPGPPIRQQRLRPPLNAEFLFYFFLTPQNCDAIVGDLEERYKLIHKKFGRRRANLWYWTQTVVSLGPIVWAWAKKVSLKPVAAVIAWAVGKGLVGHDGWLVALVELWKRVRL